MSQALAGRRVLVTRATGQAGKLTDGLGALGVIPVEVPVLEIRPPESLEALDIALRKLESYDWLILTSANAVCAMVERASLVGVSLSSSTARPAVAAVGSATCQAARDAGMPVRLTPKDYVAESLVGALSTKAAGARVLLARAAIARDVIPDALRASGATVDVVDAYRNVMPEAAPAQLRAALAGGLDAAAFTSSSSVTHLAKAARIAEVPFPLAGVAAISIGPITSATLREYNWPPAGEAEPHDVSGLIAAVVRGLNR